jgi:hypothetical protein
VKGNTFDTIALRLELNSCKRWESVSLGAMVSDELINANAPSLASACCYEESPVCKTLQNLVIKVI